ncbi:MAG: polysaccharide deacetylase [Lachnospiraceae bacterium]|nr:polysaccharide deacetylase [Lachnospiraceae bacterium]
MSNDKNAAKKAEMIARKKRVQRLKKMIVATIIIFLLLPSILCVALWIRLARFEKRYNDFLKTNEMQYAKMKKLEDEKEEKVEKVEKVDGKALAAEVESTDPVPTNIPEVEDQTLIEGKKVYLTFDDGPSQNTEQILDILKENDVKATFFVIGHTDEHSLDMYKRIVDEGHTLAMHSYSHQYAKIYKSVKAFAKDMNSLSDLLYTVTGERTHFIRFPGGSSNTVSAGDMTDFIRYANRAGYVYFDWNTINGDATGQNLTDNEMINNVMSNVNIFTNSVVLMHDCAGKEQTVKTLPKIINKLKKKHVTMLPINDTTPLVQHIKAEDVGE